MLTGMLPIEAKSPVGFVRAHCMDAPVPLRSRGVSAPAAVEVILTRALSKTVADRPTAGDIVLLEREVSCRRWSRPRPRGWRSRRPSGIRCR